LGDHVVKIQGVNGGTVSSMFRKLVDIEEFQPNVVFLQIGSNDIGNSKVTVKDVLMSIEILIDALLLLGAKCVMFGLLIQREKVWAKRGLTLHENNSTDRTTVYTLDFYYMVAQIPIVPFLNKLP
jgi:hypothetical protein